MSSLKKILIFSRSKSARLDYVSQHMAGFFVDVVVDVSDTLDDAAQYDIVIGYGAASAECHLSIPAHGLLNEVGLFAQDVEVKKEDGLACFFDVPESNGDYGFDLFSMIFFLLSRYEEYGNTDTDEHGRYKSKNSLAVKYDFLQLALVDRWLWKLSDKIAAVTGHQLEVQEYHANQCTIDIDMPYAYKYKGLKAYAGMARDILSGSLDSASSRWRYWWTNQDPFDTYDYLIDHFRKCQAKPYVFILNRYKKPHDENHLAQTDLLKAIVNKLAEVCNMGIHPSYTSHDNPDLLKEELESLAQMTSLKGRSRQHFIKMSLPGTYKGLLELGITEDHSMIYSDRIGYRASTSRPFRWYDISTEATTTLMLYPYAVMDVTLRYYLRLTPEESIDKIKQLSAEAAQVHGTLGWLWHNSSLSRAYGWVRWKPVFEHLILH